MSRAVDSVLGAAKSGATMLQQRASHGQKLVFFHVPKCGGTSVEEALRRAMTLRGFGESRLNPRAAKAAADAMGEPHLDLRESWLVYELARNRNALIAGHIPWSPAVNVVKGDYKLVTLLREPNQQFLSEFFFNRDNTDDHFSIPRETTLKNFLTTPIAADIGSKFVRYFTDPHLRSRASSDEAIAAACSNIAQLDVVGTLEQLNLWSAHVGILIGRRLDVGHRRLSPTPKARRDEEADGEAIAMIEEICKPNHILYRRVCDLQSEQERMLQSTVTEKVLR